MTMPLMPSSSGSQFSALWATRSSSEQVQQGCWSVQAAALVCLGPHMLKESASLLVRLV